MRNRQGRRGITRAVGVALAIAGLVAACGGGDDDDSDSGATTASDAAATTVADAPTTVADVPDTTVAAAADTTDAPGGGWEAVTAAAADEGKVTLYSTQVLPILEELETQFEAAHPDIDLEVVRGLPQDLVPTLDIERQTGSAVADVYVAADAQYMQESGAAAHFVEPVGPNFDNDAYDRESNVREGGYFLSHAVVFGWGWNTDQLPDGLDGFEGLLDPSLAGGKIAVIEPANQALVDFWLYLEDQLGAEFVASLAAQEPRIYPGGGPIQEALTSGEVQATIYAGAAIEDGKAAGAPIDWAIPATPWGARYWGGVFDIAPHPNAAQVLVDYLVSPEGQEVVAKGNASTLPDIPGTVADLNSVPEQDTAKLTTEFVQSYLEQWRSMFQ